MPAIRATVLRLRGLDVTGDLPKWKGLHSVSNMESNSDRAPQNEANDALDSLTVDRERLVERLRVPWALMAAFGALGAWWVGAAASAEPGGPYEPPVTGWMALLGALVVAHLVRRETGVRFRAMGARATWAVIGILVTCLALFSVSLGLVSMDLRWGVAITSVAAFVVTTGLAGLAYRSAVKNLRRE